MKKAFIVIDMQNDFVYGSLANADAQTIVVPIANAVKGFDGSVFATRDTHTKDYLLSSEGKNLPVEHCIKNTQGWEIVPEIQTALNEQKATILDKPTFGYLDWGCLKGFDEATLVGTCTDICVVSNALILKALYPDLRVKVIPSLCAGTTKENHLAAIAVMQCCQVEIEK